MPSRRRIVAVLAAMMVACGSSAVPSVTNQNDDAGAPPVAPASDASSVDVDGGASDAAPPMCSGAVRDTDAPAQAASAPAKLAGQDAWIHDEGSAAGYFHTFDALRAGTGAQLTPRKVHVFLPKSYPSSAAACRRYPVVYFNDGDTTFFPGGAANKSWDVAGVLAKAYAGGKLEEVIVVAVHPLERDREYTHAAWLAGRSCCESPAYVSYLADAVKPFIDGAYRTRAGAVDTVIAGSSHGGLVAFFAATTRPDVFGKAIAMSSSFWAGLDGMGGGALAGSALLQAAAPGLAKKPRLYLDWGLVRTGGAHNAIIEERATARGVEMSTLLTTSYGYTKDKDLVTVEDPQGEHDETSWGRRIGHALEVVLSP